jgi:hypothetical protein
LQRVIGESVRRTRETEKRMREREGDITKERETMIEISHKTGKKYKKQKTKSYHLN